MRLIKIIHPPQDDALLKLDEIQENMFAIIYTKQGCKITAGYVSSYGGTCECCYDDRVKPENIEKIEIWQV